MHSVSILRRRALFSSESPYSPGGFPFDVRLVICSDEILPAIKEADIIYDKIKKRVQDSVCFAAGSKKSPTDEISI